MYETGDYNFIYATLVCDSSYWSGGHEYGASMQPYKDYAVSKFNYAYYPTTYTDGGEYVFIGGYPQWGNYTVPIQNAGARAVPDMGFTVSMTWLGSASAEITVTITNNEYENYPPDVPSAPTGPAMGEVDNSYEFTCIGTDPNRQQVYYKWDWGDGEISDWQGPYDYGQEGAMSHAWTAPGQYYVSVMMKDIYDAEGGWSSTRFIDIWECGDTNDDNGINILDIVMLINYKYKEGEAPVPEKSGDVNNDGNVNILDIVALINFKYKDGDPPVCPSL